jgi:hypothetical protein
MQGSLSVERMCRVAGVSRASFYRWLEPPPPVEQEVEVRAAYDAYPATPGSDRLPNLPVRRNSGRMRSGAASLTSCPGSPGFSLVPTLGKGIRTIKAEPNLRIWVEFTNNAWRSHPDDWAIR